MDALPGKVGTSTPKSPTYSNKLFPLIFRTRELETRAKKSGKPRKPLHEWTIVQCGLWGTAPLERNIKPRPVGSWTTPEYVDGVLVGWWLNFQFDPDAEDYEDFYGSFVRFRPIDADWDWGYVPTNDK